MKVKELITELQNYSPEATVRVSSPSEEYDLEVAEVYLDKHKIVHIATLEVEEPEEDD